MKYAVLAVALVACGDGESTPDARIDALDRDGPTSGLIISQVLPDGGHTLPLDQQGQYRVTVSNIGPTTGPITAMLTGSTDFTIVTNGCTTLVSGGLCEIELRLVPSVIGAIDAQLVVSATPGESATASLHGTGLQRNTLQMPDRVDFHSRAVGQTSSPLAVVVTNTGTVATGPLTVSLPAGKYALTADGCTGQMIASQATCTFSIVYTPTTTVALGTGGDLSQVTVTGTPGGIDVATVAGGGATILLDEWQYLFANTTVGQTSAAKTLTLTNTQSFSIGPLATNLQFLGAPFVVQDNCNGLTLAPQGTCTYVVSFRPTATGQVAGSLLVDAPDVGSLSATAGTTLAGTGQ